MSFHKAAPSDSETGGSFGFLKTVVSDSPSLERNDSDKENDHGLMTVSEESSEETKGGVGISKGSQGQGHLNTTMAKDEEKDMWDDFYNDEDFGAKKDESLSSNSNVTIRSTAFTTNFEIENNRVLDKVDEEQEGVDGQSQGDDYSSTFDSSVKDDIGDGDPNNNNDNEAGSSKKKPLKKKRKLFKRRKPPPLVTTSEAIGGSYPELGRDENSVQTNQLETMSESGGAGDRGRRLNRRKQAARPRCAGPTPSGDVLQQKYQELEHLVLKPLPNPAVYVKQTRQQMLRLQGLSSQYHVSNYSGSSHVDGLPPPSGSSHSRDERNRQNHVIVEGNNDEGYSTIRTIQVVQNGTNSSTSTRQNRPQTAHPRRPRSGHRDVRPASAGRGRPTSAGRGRPTSANRQIQENTANTNGTLQSSQGRGSRGRGENKSQAGRSQSGSGRGSCRSDSGSKDRSSRDSRNASSDNPSRSNSRSPGRVVSCTDTHLKHSDNAALRQWLKTKNKQHRQQKLEERKKKRVERAEKQEIERKRQEMFQDSDLKVKEWMTKKRKEAFKKAKEEKKRIQEDEMQMIEWKEQSQYTGSLRGHSIRRPQSAPAHSDRKMFIPVIRPDGDYNAANNETKDLGNSETPIPQPPKSKFVYKRPVSGRVRLMKLQQERKDDSKKQEMKKKEMEKLTEEEKNRKMRMSYDQWLVKKRQEDYEKRQKAARERALAKSDPELERIVPEMARRRIENIQRGKKRIQTNVDSINDQVNKSFGGGDFGAEEVGSLQDAPGLQVSGQRKSLGQRPGSAKLPSSNGPLNPQMSRSPRRPKSAHPRVQSIMDDSEEQQVVDAKAFQLPFPPELGVPKYVAERQEKLFSAKVMEKASMDTSSLSSDAKLEDTESQQPPANAENDNVQGGETENDSHCEKSAKIEPQDSSKAETANDILDDAKTEHDNVDSSFFVTVGNVEIVEMVSESILSEAIPAEAFDDEDENEYLEDMTQDEQENNENKYDTMKEEGVSQTTNVDFKNEEEEKTMSDLDEEAPAIPEMKKMEEVPAETILQELDETLDREIEYSEEFDHAALLDEKIIEQEVTLHSLAEELDQSVLLDEKIIEQEVTLHSILKESMEEEQSVGEVKEDTRQETQMEQKEVQEEEEEPKSEASEGKSSTKHVSFVEEAEIHEDPLAGIPPEDYDTYSEDDEAEDERGDFYGDESPRNEQEFFDADDKIESYDDDDNF